MGMDSIRFDQKNGLRLPIAIICGIYLSMEFVAFDLETTGKIPGSDKIIEIGLVKFVNSKVVDKFQTFVNPEVLIPAETTQVHGITDEMVKNAPLIQEVLPKIVDFVGNYILVAHNASFDVGFLEWEFRYHKIPTPAGPVLDTLALARRLIPGLPNYRLSTLVAHFKLKAPRFHRAVDDAQSCGFVFLELLKFLKFVGNKVNEDVFQNILGQKLYRFPKIEKSVTQMSMLDLF